MATKTETLNATYACGCVVEDDVWDLCPDCAARIGRHGTCLGCGGPADEQWVHADLPEDTFCTADCAARAAWLAADDA